MFRLDPPQCISLFPQNSKNYINLPLFPVNLSGDKRNKFAKKFTVKFYTIEMSKNLKLAIFFLFVTFSVTAQEQVTLSGYVKDVNSGEALIAANVYFPELFNGTISNDYGFYSITLPKGRHEMIVTYVGYQPLQRTLEINSDTTLELELQPDLVEMEEVVVRSNSATRNVHRIQMSANKLSMEAVRAMPSLLGEVDILRSVQSLPGVSTVGEGTSGFNVRGGGIDQNLILLDEAPVYNSSHLLGFFSVFNPDAVKDVNLVKGGIPAQYGGRLSSLLDVRLKEGNLKEMQYSGGVGLVSSRFSVEGPLQKDVSSFIVAGRRTYGDLFLKLSSDPELSSNQLYFYDLTGKTNYTINENNRIYLSGYFGKDVFNYEDDMSMDWGNATGTLRWNHLFSSKLFSNVSLIYSDYSYGLKFPGGVGDIKWTSKILTSNIKADFDWYLAERSKINFGASTMLYGFNPGKAVPAGEGDFQPLEMERQRGLESAVYIDHEQRIGEKILMQYGLRVSSFHYLGEQTVYDYVGEPGERKEPVNPRTYGKGETIEFYPNLEPRFSLRYSLNDNSALKFSYNRMAQYIHLISNTAAASPLDIWSPSTAGIEPALADQVALGYFRKSENDDYEFSVESYYKHMSNQIDYVDGADLLLNENLEAELLYGSGRSYGLEFFLKKSLGSFTGWLSYSLSKSERKIEGINNNEFYPVKYDRTHNLTATAIYEISPRLSLSGNFVYTTGVATTFPNGRYEQGGIIVPINTDNSRNNYRIPDYHRLDLALTLKGKRRASSKFQSDWVFSLYNVYARRNAFSVYFQQNEDDPSKTEAVRMSVFASVIPSVSYNFKF